jgi:hypothetical protein
LSVLTPRSGQVPLATRARAVLRASRRSRSTGRRTAGRARAWALLGRCLVSGTRIARLSVGGRASGATGRRPRGLSTWSGTARSAVSSGVWTLAWRAHRCRAWAGSWRSRDGVTVLVRSSWPPPLALSRALARQRVPTIARMSGAWLLATAGGTSRISQAGTRRSASMRGSSLPGGAGIRRRTALRAMRRVTFAGAVRPRCTWAGSVSVTQPAMWRP